MLGANLIACLLLSPAALVPAGGEGDLRELYDVTAYELEFAVRPEERVLEGRVRIEAEVLGELAVLHVDLCEGLKVLSVDDGSNHALRWTHPGEALFIELAEKAEAGSPLAVTIRYRGSPRSRGSFDGFHWAKTRDGRPWINTSCQGTGSHAWWPGKASYFHPEDKPERVTVSLTVPADLYGVSNGRLQEVRDLAPTWFDADEGSWKTFHWVHPYPLETYSVTLNVAPYVVVESELVLPGIEEPVPWIYYVLPESLEKARLQFRDVPKLLEIYSDAFGPFPFPESKFALVETNFWGMEHSSAVAYGSSFPAWCKETGTRDRYARRNRYFDYILVHEVAHEWWGNAVSANDWGHFWIHEGFGTYAEGVYLEQLEGRDVADRYFRGMSLGASGSRGRLYRGEHPDSGDAYTGLIYNKGGCVLHTLRHYLEDDEAWWKSLRQFNEEYRYGNADTEDFREILEENTEAELKWFFDQWFYGTGSPRVRGRLAVEGKRIRAELEDATGAFRCPVDLAWTEGEEPRSLRLWIPAGEKLVREIQCAQPPSGLRVENLRRLLGRHDIEIEGP